MSVYMAMTRLKSDTKQAVKAIAQTNDTSEDEAIKMLLAVYEQGNGADSGSRGAVEVLPPVDSNSSSSDLLKRLEAIEGHVGANTQALARSLAVNAAKEAGKELDDDASSAAQFQSYLDALRKSGAHKHVLETVEKQAKALSNG